MGSRILEWQTWRIGFSGVNKSVLGGLKRDSLTPPRRDLLTPPRATPPRLDLVDKTLQTLARDNNKRSRSRNSILTVECLERLCTGWTIMTRTPVLTANSLLQVSELCRRDGLITVPQISDWSTGTSTSCLLSPPRPSPDHRVRSISRNSGIKILVTSVGLSLSLSDPPDLLLLGPPGPLSLPTPPSSPP